ncbi:mono(ADP-ribosyl)transferase SpvB [Colletotrichum liriopes]|uniref:Mono(ADP-ribosyl)transferase SpvB n=1 Tax=Colletotrichum liriopes TaxID=708192 RepID=A0AA37LYM9_9PEZI|nr:mono(ADP-ribosyl)transferase SpvB [Colletotrichum liriopes]
MANAGASSSFNSAAPNQPSAPGQNGASSAQSAAGNHVTAVADADKPFIGAAMEKFGNGGGGFRSIDEKFTVNPSNGTLSLSIPLHVSPGRSGFGPDLTLSYDSGSGNGPFGIGWGLSLNAVTRKTRKGVPKYGDSDVFILSGQEDLVPELSSADTPAPVKDPASGESFWVQSYQPRVLMEPLRVERWTSCQDEGNIFWKTINDTNTTSVYGDSPATRIFDDSYGGTRIFSWLLSTSYDTNGNAVQYVYKEEDAAGTSPLSHSHAYRNKYLSSIKYGNQSTYRDVKNWDRLSAHPQNWLFEVVLDYGEYSLTTEGLQATNDWSLRGMPSRELGGDRVVSHAAFAYEETARGSVLKAVTHHGHMLDEDGATIIEPTPPIEFTYSSCPDYKALPLVSSDAPELESLSGHALRTSRWVDLDGEGSPGLFRQLTADGPWAYQRNENAAASIHDLKNGVLRFGAPVLLGTQPSLSTFEDVTFEDLEGNGTLNIVSMEKHGKLLGFYGRDHGSSEWLDFQPFKSVPNMDGRDPSIMVDVTGDGRSDVLSFDQDSGSVSWYPSLTKDGFGPLQHQKGANDGPPCRRGDVGVATYLADMSGDGLDDIVQISNGAVSYWPNLGYGRFGAEIIMTNAPLLDREGFDLRRLQLADIDGSGTTDIIYYPPGGGARFYLNLAGNGWGPPIEVLAIPEMDASSLPFVTDLLGKGAPCICILRPALSGEKTRMQFMDLSGGGKPHLLTGYRNGSGLIAQVAYQPSTKYYLKDRARGANWVTSLPFAVQCVGSTLIRDELAQTAVSTTYSYRDGFYDSFDREFRGFGMVETLVEEDLALGCDAHWKTPAVRTRTWYLTGSLQLQTMSHSLPAGAHHIDSVIPKSATSAQQRELHRALKGLKRRSEIFGVADSTEKPSATSEFSYQVVSVQAREQGTPGGITRVVPRETINCTYESGPESDARIQQELVLGVNEYGDPTRTMSVCYGRKKEHVDKEADLDTRAKAQQLNTVATLTENNYTNAVRDTLNFRKPAVWQSRQTRFVGLDLSLASFEALASLKPADFELVRHDLLVPGTTKRRATLAAERILYTANDPSVSLAEGNLEAFSICFESQNLCLPAELLAELSPLTTAAKMELLLQQGGYSQPDQEGCCWATAPRLTFEGPDDIAAAEYARSSFYVPNVSTDAFGNKYTAKYDQFTLLLEESVDPMGNKTILANDYRCLRPVQVTDCNGNRQLGAFGPFSEVIATAMSGKSTQKLGDSLDGLHMAVSTEQLAALVSNPTQKVLQSLCGRATHRKIYAHRRYHESDATKRLPNFVASLTRQDHGPDSVIMLEISHLSGRGTVLESVDLLSSAAPFEWRARDRSVRDASGNVVRKFQNRALSSSDYTRQSELTVPSTFLFLDGHGRQVASLAPGGLWTKLERSTWSLNTWDAGNTLLIADPATDAAFGPYIRLLHPSYLSSWYGARMTSSNADIARSAMKSEVYTEKWRTDSLNATGQVVVSTKRLGSKSISQKMQYDALGRVSSVWDVIEQQGVLTERLTETFLYDLLGRIIVKRTMESGDTWSLPDCNGRPMVTRNTRGITHRVVRDGLRRNRQMYVQEGTASEVLTTEFVYGDGVEGAEKKNLRGKLFRLYDQAGLLVHDEYDFQGNLVKSTRQLADAYKTILDWSDKSKIKLSPGRQSQTSYNTIGLPVRLVNDIGDETMQSYDTYGRLAMVEWKKKASYRGDVFMRSIAYAADDQPTRVEYGNGTTTTYKYDEKTRIKIRQTSRKSLSCGRTKLLEDWTYVHDCLGRTTSERNLSENIVFYKGAAVKPAADYTYDSLGRLVQAMGREQVQDPSTPPHHSAVRRGAGASPEAAQGRMAEYVETYEYDAAGNMLRLRHEPVDKANSKSWTRTFVYGAASALEPERIGNRLTSSEVAGYTESYGYEGGAGSVGCMTSMSGFASLTWDLDNKLRSTTQQVVNDGVGETTWHVYDYKGDRVRKVTERAAKAGEKPRILKETIYARRVDIQARRRPR